MTAGLPGIGIGGIFYLVCALIMPVIELVRTIQGKSSRRRWLLVGRQFSFVCMIMTGFWVTGEILGLLIRGSSLLFTATNVALSRQVQGPIDNLFRVQPLFISLATLCGVILSLQIMNLLIDASLKNK